MYISDLKIHGFKSFAKKEDLRFGEGITAVVGPNGCGKTNIVDAIRWVLGEQKYSVLRSNKMEEVIFNGAKGVKPLGVCEVSLTVHNNKGKLPVEYNDIEISRRVYRNGESEYFMNKNSCRLKDIYDLFIDTGMGSDSYSVIELKMIEQILSESGNDRFRMFEEAAGINKYKLQRKHSLRKFEMVKKDLERVDDIIKEVEEKVKHLNLQLKRFKRYEKLQGDLKEFEISLGYTQLSDLKEESDPLRLTVQKFTQQRESKSTQEELNERELTRLRELYQDQATEVEDLKHKFDGLKDERNATKQHILIWNEQSHSARNQIDRLNTEKMANAKKDENYNQELRELQKEINIITPDISTAVEKHKDKKESFNELNEKYVTVQREVELYQEDRWKAQTKKTEIERQNQKSQLLIEEKSETIDELNIDIDGLKKSLIQLDKQLVDGENNISGIKNNVSKVKAKRAELKSELDRLNLDLNSTRKNIHEIHGELKSLVSQRKFYQSIITSNEGFPNGTRHILEQKTKYPGIFGAVVDLLNVEDKHALAVDSVLGDLGNCLVIKNKNSVFSVFRELKKKKLGNVSFIPLDCIPKPAKGKVALPKNPAIFGKVSDYVNCPEDISEIKNFLFGDCLLVSKIDELDESILNEWNCVDMEGHISNRGIIKFKDSENSLIQIGRQSRLKELEIIISKMKNKSEALTKKKEKIEKDISKVEKDLLSGNDNLQNITEQLSILEGEIRQFRYQKKKTEERILEHRTKQKKLNELIQQLMKSENETKKELINIEKDIEKKSLKLSQSEEKLSEQRVSRDQLSAEVQALHIDVLQLENQREQSRMKMNTAEKTIDELRLRDSEIENEIVELNNKVEGLNQNITEGTRSIEKIEAKISGIKSKLDLKSQVKENTFQDVEQLQNKIRTEQKSRESLLEEMKESEQKLMENEQKRLLIINRMRDIYEVDIPEYLDVKLTEIELQEKIQKAHRSIENIGAVNMAVQSDYDEETDRLQMLERQRSDIIKSEENLRETIQRIDKIAREKFLNTFEQINTNFTKLFTLFFEGGEGRLELIGDPDPLEADIAIRAQPPGKRNQNLRMLSAGEKSLTAIALLFAIYQYKPSPYCILDEVDAPLDDVNIRKFTRVLHQFSNETQFIVVTHNKLTMESANYLYGVTMEQKGVSKLVSVQFEA